MLASSWRILEEPALALVRVTGPSTRAGNRMCSTPAVRECSHARFGRCGQISSKFLLTGEPQFSSTLTLFQSSSESPRPAKEISEIRACQYP